jgi:hypothetical protein
MDTVRAGHLRMRRTGAGSTGVHKELASFPIVSSIRASCGAVVQAGGDPGEVRDAVHG